MTREAVKNQLDYFVNELIDGSLEKFKPLAVLGLGFLPFNGLFKWLLRNPIRQEIAQFRVTYNKKFKFVLMYAEDLSEGDADFDEYRDEILEWDYFYQNYDGPRERQFARDLDDWAKKIAEDLQPVVENPNDDFWEAAREEFTQDEIMGKFTHAFSLADLLKEYEDGIDLRQPRHPVTFFIRLRYTGEALRALDETEAELLEELRRKTDEVFVGKR